MSVLSSCSWVDPQEVLHWLIHSDWQLFWKRGSLEERGSQTPSGPCSGRGMASTRSCVSYHEVRFDALEACLAQLCHVRGGCSLLLSKPLGVCGVALPNSWRRCTVRGDVHLCVLRLLGAVLITTRSRTAQSLFVSLAVLFFVALAVLFFVSLAVLSACMNSLRGRTPITLTASRRT